MRLYHFTAERFVASILRHGITRGYVLVDFDRRRLNPDYRWLTTNPDWQQEWAEGTGRLAYRRDERRLTVEIPPEHHRHVLRWTVTGPLLTPEYRTLSMLGDPDNWRLFRGDVRPEWIAAVDENPLFVLAAPSPSTGSPGVSSEGGAR